MEFSAMLVAFSALIIGAACVPIAELTTDVDTAEDVSHSPSNHAILRPKRDANNCSLPYPRNSLDIMLRNLHSSALARISRQPTVASVPPYHPHRCEPRRTVSWRLQSSTNLAATCPWFYRTIDLGDNSYYPRHIQEAECMCSHCINANARSCEKIRSNLVILKKVACQDGVAVMSAVMLRISIGCRCSTGVRTRSRAPHTE